MSYATLKRITMTCGIVVIVAIFAGKMMEYGFIRELLGASLGNVAATVSAIPLCLVAVFFVLQAIPGGRPVVPVPGTKSDDTWLIAFVACQFVPTFELREFVPAGRWGSTADQALGGLLVLTLAIVVRGLQVRRRDRGRSAAAIRCGVQ